MEHWEEHWQERKLEEGLEWCGEAVSSGCDVTASQHGAEAVAVAYRTAWLSSHSNKINKICSDPRLVVSVMGLLLFPLWFGCEMSPYARGFEHLVLRWGHPLGRVCCCVLLL